MRRVTAHNALVMFLAFFVWTGCGSDSDSNPEPSAGSDATPGMDNDSSLPMVQVISTDDRFSILSQVIQDQSLSDLFDDTDMTFFAPTNAAFESLSTEDREQLLTDQAQIRELLRHHIVSGQLSRQELSSGENILSLTDNPLRIQVNGNEDIMVNDVAVSPEPLLASNGFIYAVAGFFAPVSSAQAELEESEFGIYEIIAANENLSIFAELVRIGGVDEALNTNGPFTVFAPTNDAFENIDPERLASILRDQDAAATIIELHTVANRYLLEEIESDSELRTLSGVSVSTSRDGSSLVIDKAKLIQSNIPAKNGVLHIVDRVFILPTVQ